MVMTGIIGSGCKGNGQPGDSHSGTGSRSAGVKASGSLKNQGGLGPKHREKPEERKKSGKSVSRRATGKGRCWSEEDEKLTNYHKEVVSPGGGELPPPWKSLPDSSEVWEAISGAASQVSGSSVISLEAGFRAKIYSRPDATSVELGILRKGERIPAAGMTQGPGCEPGWVRIGLHAYVCSVYMKPSPLPPTVRLLPVVPSGRNVPGMYGYVRAGGTPYFNSVAAVKAGKPSGQYPAGFYLHKKKIVSIGHKAYWKTYKLEYVPTDRIARHHPSDFFGFFTRDVPLPAVIVTRWTRQGPADAYVYDRPAGRIIGRVKYHTAHHVYGDYKVRWVGRYYRIGRCRWVKATHVSGVFADSPPPGLRKGERWVDINLKRQTLVAYDGVKPVFFTAVSTGKKGHETRHGVFRVYWKVTEGDMKNEVGAEEQYLASSVPWAMYFWKGQAIHAAYWHDQFGHTKSHGCVNVSPADARWLFEWTEPTLGPGWLYRWAGRNYPGMVVRVKRSDHDRPMVHGYARRIVPREKMRRLDEEWKRRIQEETMRIIQRANEAQKNRRKERPSGR